MINSDSVGVSDCAASALAGEAARTVAAYDAVDAHASSGQGVIDKHMQEAMTDALSDYLRSTIERATYLKTSTGYGAVFQLAAVGYFLHDIDEALGDGDEKAGCAALHKIRRLLHSVIDFIETTNGTKLDAEIAFWCMRRDTTAHAYLEEAFKILDDKRA